MRTVNLRTTGITLLSLSLLVLAGCSRVKDDWKAAQTTDTAEAYQQFIREHGDSEFASQAEARVQQLLEDADWKAAAAADTRDAYEQFVAQHADGKWAQEARVRIENFKLTAAGGAAPATAAATAAAGTAAAGTSAPTAPAAPAPEKTAPGTTKPAAAAPKPQSRPQPQAQTPSKPSTRPAAGGKPAHVQLGAFGSATSAREAWNKLKARWPRQTGGLKASYEPVKSGGKTLYRLRVTLGSHAAAEQFCGTLKQQKQACIVLSE